jgi:hypothetical protein
MPKPTNPAPPAEGPKGTIPSPVDDFLRNLKVQGTVQVLNKPGAVKLDGFPRLAYAPGQWGPGVRTEDKGVPVAEIATAFATASGNPGAVAKQFNTTEAHVMDAVRYAEQAGFLGRAD